MRQAARVATRRSRRAARGTKAERLRDLLPLVGVSRIMTDVEGVRNLIGTGLVELAGGLRR